MKNRIARGLQKLSRVQAAHPGAILLAAILLAVLAVFYSFRNLEFQTGQRDLISRGNRLVKLADKIGDFDDLDSFMVVIDAPHPDRALQFLQALVPRLQADRENYLEIFYRVDPKEFKGHELLYLKKKDLATLGRRLQEHREFIHGLARAPGLTAFLGEVNREMTRAMVGELFTGFLESDRTSGKEEPFDLSFLIRVLEQMNLWLDGRRDMTSPWERLLSGDAQGDDEGEGYFWTKNKRYLLVFVTPRKIEDSFSNTQHALSALRKAIAALAARFPDVEAGVTGREALNEDEMGIAFRDMTLATLISLAGLTLLLVLFWGGLKRPLLEITELILALSWTFGLTTLFIGHLNILSITFAPLLLGLGIDYGIHWLARYQEERVLGAPLRQAVETTGLRLGPGIILAGLTASLSFFPLVLTGFKGLAELGLITAVGMLMTTVTTLGVLPALIFCFDRPAAGRVRAASRCLQCGLRLARGGALAVLIAGLVALALSAWAAGGVAFDLNMLHLQSQKAEAVVWENKLLAGSEGGSMFGAALAYSLEDVRRKSSAFAALPGVSEVESVLSLLPEDQQEKIALLRQMQPLVAGIEPAAQPAQPVVAAELTDILSRIRFKMLGSSESDWGQAKPLESQMIRVRNLIDRLRVRLQGEASQRSAESLAGYAKVLRNDFADKLNAVKANTQAQPMEIRDLPAALLARFVGENHLYLIRIFPVEDIWEPARLKRFVEELQSVDPDVVGDPVTLHVFTQQFRNASMKAAVYAVVFICILLLATFRNILETLLVLIPLVVGTAWTLGSMRLLKVDFNLANSIFLPLVVGAGVEYGIIIMQRLHQERTKGSRVVIPFSTVKGVVLAGLTTTVGFGSLMLSAHQGIRSLGLLATVGSLSILAAAVIFLPALLQVAALRRVGGTFKEEDGKSCRGGKAK